MLRTDLSHWLTVMREVGGRGDLSTWHAGLVNAYSEPQRQYHNLRHLTECLTELDAMRDLVRSSAIVETAVWFHDVVYDPQSLTNEEDSAALAQSCLMEAGVAKDRIEIIRRLILSTKTHQPSNDGDTALLIDLDLAILGKPPERFWDYERGIRAEYVWVPEATYRQKRAEILERFLARPTIYQLPPFRERYELSARENLSSAISRLKQSELR